MGAITVIGNNYFYWNYSVFGYYKKKEKYTKAILIIF